MKCRKCGEWEAKCPSEGLCMVCEIKSKQCDICKEQVKPPEYVWMNASRGVKGHKACIDDPELNVTPAKYTTTYTAKELDKTVDALQYEIIERLVSEHFEKAKNELLKSLFLNMYTKGGVDTDKNKGNTKDIREQDIRSIRL
jgi:hypothetical protein